MPMLDAFRLMIVYTLFDPLKTSLSALFVAVGRPNQVTFARLVQFSVLIVGLFSLGSLFGINGVALAVDIMLVVGIALLLWRARIYVDYSITKLLGMPLLGVVGGIILAVLAKNSVSVESDWIIGGVKVTVFSVVYIGTLILLERENFDMVWRWLKGYYGERFLSLLGKV
jgi:O-antigen/teichoic acid export membrane protein